MEFILENTDIFDEEIGAKFNEVIKANKENFDKEKVYKFVVSFHVNLLRNSQFDKFVIPEPSYKRKKDSLDVKINGLLGFQLKKLQEILNENSVEAVSSSIQGDILKAENIIKIELNEDTSEPSYYGRGKNKKRLKVNHIMPNLPYIQKTVSELCAEGIVKLYFEFMKNGIGNKKIISEILGIEETEDEFNLVKAFADQYGELGFVISNKDKEPLFNQLKERSLLILNKYLEKEEKQKGKKRLK